MIFVNGIPTEYGLAEVKRMIDEKKLLEKIDNNVPDLTSDQIYKIAEVIVKQPKVNEWIPCSERLPEVGEKVLCSLNPGNPTIIHLVVIFQKKGP